MAIDVAYLKRVERVRAFDQRSNVEIAGVELDPVAEVFKIPVDTDTPAIDVVVHFMNGVDWAGPIHVDGQRGSPSLGDR